MAKYYFEKWDYNWDKSILTAEGLYNASTYAYVIQKNGEVADRVPFADAKVGDFFPAYPDRYNNGTSVDIFRKIDATRQRRYIQITKAEIQATVAKTTLIETIVADENEYPENGIQGDYWYVRGEKAFPSLKLNGLTIGGAKIKDSTGQVRNVGNIYFKDSAGVVRNLK